MDDVSDILQQLEIIKRQARQMEYYRTMFRFAFERGVAFGLVRDKSELSDIDITDAINRAIEAWNEDEIGANDE